MSDSRCDQLKYDKSQLGNQTYHNEFDPLFKKEPRVMMNCTNEHCPYNGVNMTKKPENQPFAKRCYNSAEAWCSCLRQKE